MTQLARQKLQEARYFFERMGELKGKPEFDFVLSAFLSAGRSVTLLLQAENAGESGFSDWYEEKQDDMREWALFDAMREARNYSQKEGYPEISKIEITTEEFPIQIYGYGSAYSPREWLEEGHISQDDITILNVGEIQKHLDEQHSTMPFLDTCQEFIDQLDEIVSEWEEQLEHDSR